MDEFRIAECQSGIPFCAGNQIQTQHVLCGVSDLSFKEFSCDRKRRNWSVRNLQDLDVVLRTGFDSLEI